ncbi:hypothetical protein GGI35DRAFT_273433 [Trichoderma velutinum]
MLRAALPPLLLLLLLGNLLEILESHGRTRNIVPCLSISLPNKHSLAFSLSRSARVHLVPRGSFPKGVLRVQFLCFSSTVAAESAGPVLQSTCARYFGLWTQTLVAFQLTSGATALWHRYTFSIVACCMWFTGTSTRTFCSAPSKQDVNHPSRMRLF